MKRTCTAVLLLVISISVAAQQTTTGQSSTTNTPPAAANPQAPSTGDQKNETKKETNAEKKARREREKKELQAKKNSDDEQAGAQDASTFGRREANDVLGQIRDGLEGHSQRLMLRAFDGDKMDGYLSFQDQLDAFFTEYEGIRVNIRIIQTSMEAGKGVVTANIQMEATPRNGSAIRREAQLRFELEHTTEGWRVVNVSPLSFFS